MSKINNGVLGQYGAGPFERQQFGTAGVKGVNLPHLPTLLPPVTAKHRVVKFQETSPSEEQMVLEEKMVLKRQWLTSYTDSAKRWGAEAMSGVRRMTRLLLAVTRSTDSIVSLKSSTQYRRPTL